MDNTISFTVNQLIGFVTTVGGCIVVIEAVVLIVFKLISKVKAPEVEQNRRIQAVFVPPFSYKNNVPCQIWNT